MKNIKIGGWKHSGQRSSDYGRGNFHDHDSRSYASIGYFDGKGPRNYKKEKEKIYEEVCEALYWDPYVDARDLEVSVDDENCVVLTGEVDSRFAKRKAEEVSEQVSGVNDVFNRLTIKHDLDLNSDKIISRGDDGLFTQETLQR
jgi:osmotically-inducible protein OsmY